MLSDHMQTTDNFRPRPPAKVRKTNVELTATPPPAYGSTYPFPTRAHSDQESPGPGNAALNESRAPPLDDGSPPLALSSQDARTTSMRRMPINSSWSRSRGRSGQSPYEAMGTGDAGRCFVDHGTTVQDEEEDLQWMNDRPREELQELLMKAHGIIKERENALGRSSTTVKEVYEHNVALKSRHEALLARIPMTPAAAPSPDLNTARSRMSNSAHFPASASESSVSDQFNSTRTRKVSIAMADISLLADQNAELLTKLQKLEEDSTSADVAGRRELKRLEKEIVYLREALEKTQAKSEELEGKVTKAVSSDAVRRRREVMRSADNKVVGVMLDFAPPGSKYGGPSEAYSLLGNDSPGWRRPSSTTTPPRRDAAAGDIGDSPNMAQEPHDQILITQLLEKVKELEETNNRILTQQMETSDQLATVQRDAMTMTKVYEFLSDRDAIELEFESDANSPGKAEKVQVNKMDEGPEPPTIRFRSLKRNIENSFGSSSSGSFDLPRLLNESTKSRRSVLGLFEADTPTTGESHMHRRGHGHGHGRRSSSQESRSSSISSTPLSPLHFFSSSSSLPHQTQSDLPPGLTLQSELENKFGQGSSSSNWGISSGSNHHLRNGSLSNLSQFSAPPTPSLAPSGLAIRIEDESDDLALSETESKCHTPTRRRPAALLLADEISPAVSVEPPTPRSHAQDRRDRGGNDDGHDGEDEDEKFASSETMVQQKKPGSGSGSGSGSISGSSSSRLQSMSKTLRSRKNRWFEKMFHNDQGSHGSSLANNNNNEAASSAASLSEAKATLSDAVDDSTGTLLQDDAAEANASDITTTTDDDDESRDSSNDDDDDDSADRKGAAGAGAGASLSGTTPNSTTVNAELALEIQGQDAQTTTAMAVSKRHDDDNAETGKKAACKRYAFQAWLWVQFAIVVFVFIFAMARKGPGAILVSGSESGSERRRLSKGGKGSRKGKAVARRIL